MLSDDYDLDNIGESLHKILEQSGLTNVEIDVGDKTFYITGGTTAVIDWSNEDAVNAGKDAIKEWVKSHSNYFENGFLANNPEI
jgi:hypothetical protein